MKLMTYVKNKFNKEDIMRVAVPIKNEEIFQHFGHSKKFNIYNLENNEIKLEDTVDTDQLERNEIVCKLSDLNVDTVLCGTIGKGAQRELKKSKIELYVGLKGNIQDILKELLNGSLIQDDQPNCSRHGSHRGGAHRNRHHSNGCCGTNTRQH